MKKIVYNIMKGLIFLQSIVLVIMIIMLSLATRLKCSKDIANKIIDNIYNYDSWLENKMKGWYYGTGN